MSVGLLSSVSRCMAARVSFQEGKGSSFLWILYGLASDFLLVRDPLRTRGVAVPSTTKTEKSHNVTPPHSIRSLDIGHAETKADSLYLLRGRVSKNEWTKYHIRDGDWARYKLQIWPFIGKVAAFFFWILLRTSGSSCENRMEHLQFVM